MSDQGKMMRFHQKVGELEKRVVELLNAPSRSNADLRKMYGEIGVLQLDIAENSGVHTKSIVADYIFQGGTGSSSSKGGSEVSKEGPAEIHDSLQRLAELSKNLDLGFLRRKGGNILTKFFDKLDEIMRIMSVWFYLIDASLFIMPVSATLNLLYPKGNFNVVAKNLIGLGCIKMSGIMMSIEGLDESTFQAPVSVLGFSHASTMDAFILAAAVPVMSYTLAKKELFLIPFFAWSLAVYGGVAVDRNNRSQAVQALHAAVERASVGGSGGSGSVVAISPEGTRSTSGQIKAFKKGMFYIWEELQQPVIPMLIFGAYDLYPRERYMSLPGKVTVRYLPPILPAEAQAKADGNPCLQDMNSRDCMSLLLRRRMLESTRSSPDLGEQSGLTLAQRLENLACVLACYAFNIMAFITAKRVADSKGWGYWAVGGWCTLATAVISIMVYLYNVYVFKPSGKKGATTGTGTSTGEEYKAKQSDPAIVDSGTAAEGAQQQQQEDTKKNN